MSVIWMPNFSNTGKIGSIVNGSKYVRLVLDVLGERTLMYCDQVWPPKHRGEADPTEEQDVSIVQLMDLV